MSERSHEELSALMDGEASDMELRRTLKALDSDSELIQKWRRYHLMRAAVQGDVKGVRSATFARCDLTQAVSAAIEAEPAHDVDFSTGKAGWFSKALQPLGSVAVAASVSAMVVFGWQLWQQQGGDISGPQVAATQDVLAAQGAQAGPTLVASARSPQSASVMRAPAQASAYTLADSRGAAPSRPMVQQEILRMPASQNQRLNHYLVSHSGNAALNTVSGPMSYSRVVHIAPE